MTIQEFEEKMAGFLQKAQEDCTIYNQAVIDGNAAEVIISKGEDIANSVTEYNKYAQIVTFEKLMEYEEPLTIAAIWLSYGVLSVKDEKDNDTGVVTRMIVSKDKEIDPLALHKYIKGGVGADKSWNYMLEKFNYLMTARVAEEVGISADGLKELNDSYAMAKISRDIAMGKTVVSNTAILKTLTGIIQAMIGKEYKATSHDVKYLTWTYGKKGKVLTKGEGENKKETLTVKCLTHKQMRAIIMTICHKILTNGEYGVEFKRERAK